MLQRIMSEKGAETDDDETTRGGDDRDDDLREEDEVGWCNDKLVLKLG